MFSTSKDKIYEVYAALKADFKIEDDRDLKTYMGIDMDRCPYGSIHLRQPYLTQRILEMIPGMDNSSAKQTHMVKPPLAKNEESQA